MVPGEGSGGGGQEWTDDNFYQQNRDWIPRPSSTPFFDFQYVQPPPDSQQLSLPNASGTGSEVRPAGTMQTSHADASWYSYHGQNWNIDNDFQSSQYGWPVVAAPIGLHDASIQSVTNADAIRDPPEPAETSSLFPNELLESPSGQVSRRDFARTSAVPSPPASREASRTPASKSPTSTRRRTVADPLKLSTTRALSPDLSQVGSSRKRRNTARSPLARQVFESHTPFQPNEEEEARRIHMAAFSRGESVSNSSPSRSQGTSGKDSAKTEANLRAAESELIESMEAGRIPGVLRTSHPDDGASDQFSLPPGKGFPIQIGSELFRLSGASIMSDSPSYFSRFFEEQIRQNEDGTGGVRTLYIDRDPATFHDICRHLQGYVVQPTDGAHYVRLFADAQFYSLPRLISQLFDSETVVQIGGENFQIPRDIFSGVGDTPNFFSLGFAVFFSTPNGVFPGLHPAGLLRPPPIKPPTVPNRSARVFSELLHMLRGYPLTIRDDNHRAELLRDARYFNLRGLEQKLITHDITFNAERDKSEIIIRLDDIRQSGVSFVAQPSPSDRSPLAGWVHYARPFVDEEAYELVLEIADESTKVDFRSMRADFYGLTKQRISKLFQVVANKMNLPVNAPLGLMMSKGGAGSQDASPGNTPLSEDRVKIRIGSDAFIILDGDEYPSESQVLDLDIDQEMQDSAVLENPTSRSAPSSAQPSASSPLIGQSKPPSRITAQPPPRKKRRRGSLDDFGEWVIRRGQWRLRIQSKVEAGKRSGSGSGSSAAVTDDNNQIEIVMHAVKLDAVSGQRGRNMMRSFLTGNCTT